MRRPLTALGAAVALALGVPPQAAFAQTPFPSPSHIVIPFLANDSKPADLDFEGAECERDERATTMDCVFQQVFLTTADTAPDACLVTTNRYERTFRRDGASHWTSTEGPDEACGLVDVVTLQDDGGVRWTMENRKAVTKNGASAACKSIDTATETFSWRNIRRPLPCRFVQPGGLSR